MLEIQGRTPFSLMCQNGMVYTISLLIKRGHVGAHNVDEWCTREASGETPLVRLAQVHWMFELSALFVPHSIFVQALVIGSVVYQVRLVCAPFCQLLSFVRSSTSKHLEVGWLVDAVA
jgi:hypothetical protein